MSEYIHQKSMSMPISCACEIVGINITKGDKTTHIYEGEITFIDHYENGKKDNDRWKAEPGKQVQKMFGKEYAVDINPTEPFWTEDLFTLQPAVDHDLRYHIMQTILEVEPDYPSLIDI